MESYEIQPPERGRVRWWKDEKGYGRITAENGDIVFCHFTALEGEGYKNLVQGQPVESQRYWGAGPNGYRWIAHKARPIEEVES